MNPLWTAIPQWTAIPLWTLIPLRPIPVSDGYRLQADSGPDIERSDIDGGPLRDGTIAGSDRSAASEAALRLATLLRTDKARNPSLRGMANAEAIRS